MNPDTVESVRMRILVLDADDRHSAPLVRDLAERGCEVARESSGVTGLVRALSEPFDVVVVAVDLPEGNGFRVCSRIKKELPGESRLVFLMGTHAMAQFESHRRLPTRADGYLQQPILAEALLGRISEARAGSAAASPPAVHRKGKTLAALRDAIAAARGRAEPSVAAGVVVRPNEDPRSTDGVHESSDAEKSIEILKRELAVALETAAELKTELIVARSRSRAVEQLLADREREVAEIEHRASAARSEREATDRRIEDLERRLLGAEESLEEALSLLRERTEAEADARSTIVAVRKQMEDEKRAAVDAVEARWSAQLDRFMKDVEGAVAGRREAQGRAEQRARSLLAANRELEERLARAVAEHEAAREVLEARVTDLTRELAASRSGNDVDVAELTTLRGEARKMVAEIAELRSALAAARSALPSQPPTGPSNASSSAFVDRSARSFPPRVQHRHDAEREGDRDEANDDDE